MGKEIVPGHVKPLLNEDGSISIGAKVVDVTNPTAAQDAATKIYVDARDYGLSFEGIVTTYTDTTHFKVSALADKGTGFFKPVAGAPYEIYVAEADGAAPEGEQTPVVAYTTADGTFQHVAFTVPLAVGDIVLIIHPLIASLGTKATAAATGAVATTKYMMAYVKQLVTQLLATDTVCDGIQTDLSNATDGLSALKTLIDAIQTDVGDPTGETLASISAKIGDIARSLDVIIGARWDSSGDLGTDIARLLTYTDILDNATNGLANIKSLIDAIPTASEIQTEMEENGASLLDTIRDDLANGTDGLGALKTLIDAVKGVVDAIPTTAMRGTDSAALASAWTAALATALGNYTANRAGYLDELAAANIPADVDTLLTRITGAVTPVGPTKAEMDTAVAEIKALVVAFG